MPNMTLNQFNSQLNQNMQGLNQNMSQMNMQGLNQNMSQMNMQGLNPSNISPDMINHMLPINQQINPNSIGNLLGGVNSNMGLNNLATLNNIPQLNLNNTLGGNFTNNFENNVDANTAVIPNNNMSGGNNKINLLSLSKMYNIPKLI
jgi:hypothetical protein